MISKIFSQHIRYVAVLIFFVVYLPIACKHTSHPQATGPKSVVGTLVLQIKSHELDDADIEVVDAEVELRSASSNVLVDSAKTSLDGRFHVTASAPGVYVLCYRYQGFDDCGGKFTVGNSTAYLGRLTFSMTGPLAHGTVLTADPRPCWVNDPFFGLDVSTKLELTDDRGNIVAKGRVNAFGEYALRGGARGQYRIAAVCENSDVQNVVTLGNQPVFTALTLPNRAPRIVAAEGFAAGVGVTRAAPSTDVDVKLTLRDPDQDNVETLWRLVDAGGSLVDSGGGSDTWTLASQPGLGHVYVIVRDGNGGYAFQNFPLSAATGDVGFSGRVIDETTQLPVANAAVEMGDATTSTNAVGWFSLQVPTTDRYVLNIRHSQYALLSRVHDRGANGNTYSLTRAQTSIVDPGHDIDITDTDSAGPCGSPGGKEQRPPRKLWELTGENKHKQEGYELQGTTGGNERKQEGYERCRHRGARIRIPAGTLVDASGAPANGPVTAKIATRNPARRAIPGDYQALDAGNARTELLSFGAVSAEFRDSSGAPLNLASGTSAEIQIPIPPTQEAAAKPQIALWAYDEKDGVWLEEGLAQQQSTPQGPVYVGKTTHFSEINMDVAGNNPANATCVRMTLDPSLSAWQNLTLRAYVSYNGDSLQVKETALDGAQYHAIFRIPFGNSFPPNTLRLELRGTFNGQEVVLLDNIINTDARPKMTGTDLWPDYPYTECGDPITLAADPINLPDYGDIDATGRPAFLTGPYGSFLPENAEQVATDYYNAIDPGGNKLTLGDWWTANGFGADGSGGTRASYLNFNDLGFGRDMHCLKNGNDLACYVTNYGLPDQTPSNADFAETQDSGQQGATVTMEYDASAPAAERVQFFVFGGGTVTAPRLKFADLDGLGPKPVPHLCLICHGGGYNTSTHKADHARFREFDLPSFRYSNGRSWDFGDTSLVNSELTAFAALNEMVRDIAPGSSPIRSLINEWYPSGFGANTPPVLPDPPSGWSGSAAHITGYHEVHGKSCRTCHVARDEGAGSPFITFEDQGDFANTSSLVCGSPKLMANAFVTYKNFWNDPTRVLLYRSLTGEANCE